MALGVRGHELRRDLPAEVRPDREAQVDDAQFRTSAGMARTCEGSRSCSIRLNASARSGAGALSTTITLPPGAATRFISLRTASGSRKWWNAKREVTIVNDPSGNGSGITSPCCHVM